MLGGPVQRAAHRRHPGQLGLQAPGRHERRGVERARSGHAAAPGGLRRRGDRYEDTAHAERAAELALQALQFDVKRFEGQGSARHLAAGACFWLVDHPLYGANNAALSYPGTGKPSGSKKGKLKTKSGTQGSREYTQEGRLSAAVGDEKAAKIRASNRNKGPESWLFVCLAGVFVLFIDVKRKWPDLYAGRTGSPKRTTGQRRTR